MDDESALKTFVSEYLQADVEALKWQPLLGDASFRRYFRIGFEESSYIAAIAPPATEKNVEFVAVSDSLNKAGILAPEVLAYDLEQGFLLQNDLGTQLLLPLLSADSADIFYEKALDQIVQMIGMDCSDLAIAEYDGAALELELSYCPDWFVSQLLLYQLSDGEKAMLKVCFDKLLISALEQPVAFVHRDYHSRNIMVTDAGELATIDFQDALIGPVTYDAISILRDCYISFPGEDVDRWRELFYQKLSVSGVVNVDGKVFARWFDFMSLQRHIKVLGVFARLSIRDGKHGYLDDLPMVFNYVLDVSAKYPELKEFHTWLIEIILPRCKKQSWGKSL